MDIEKIYKERFALEKEYLGDDKPINKIKPLVSICTSTYQHKRYIKDCLDAILIQKTNFDFELIIGEDESNDGTREICKEYAKKYPDKIRLFLRNRKTSQLHDKDGKLITRFNGKWTRESARGKYIALCEGDDYWTDPLKLQKQVDFLKKTPNCIMTYHKHHNIDLNGNLISITKAALICTIMFKNVIKDMPIVKDCPNWDRLLFTYLSLKGSFHYLDNILPSMRRYHQGGVMSMQSFDVKLYRQVRTWSVIYDEFKHTRLKKELFTKRNRFIYRKYLREWGQKKIGYKQIFLFPLKINQLSLYKLLIKKMLNKKNNI